MKQIIEDIRRLLKDGTFKDEQHVRFSLVGRICQALGWNIWNPAEFYTEYNVKKYPPQEINSDLRGRVDVALILSEKRNDLAEVFIEVKTPGKLQSELAAGETQLQKYNFWDKSAISVLTDGIVWRFYLPSIGGSFDGTLFNEINMLKDDPTAIATVFERILKRENFRKKALQTAEDMHEELRKINLLDNVKTEAEQIATKTGMSAYLIAKQLLLTKHKEDFEITEIETLWHKSVPGAEENGDSGSAITHDNYDLDHDYRFKKLKRAYVIDQWYPVTAWWQLKKTLYLNLQSKLIGLTIGKGAGISQDKTIYANPITLADGYYCEGHGSSSSILGHCRTVLKALNMDYKSSIRIEIQTQTEES
jgi:predicted type IV restriction endonuclease